MLQDVLVVEAGRRESTGWCGRMLADLGAHVLRIKQHHPRSDDVIARYLHDGKTPVQPGDDVGIVDVVVTDERDAVTEQLIELLRRANHRLVTVSVTDYGLTGPFADTPASELTLQAEAGLAPLPPTADA